MRTHSRTFDLDTLLGTEHFLGRAKSFPQDPDTFAAVLPQVKEHVAKVSVSKWSLQAVPRGQIVVPVMIKIPAGTRSRVHVEQCLRDFLSVFLQLPLSNNSFNPTCYP